jgi:hypothetical protein
MLPVLAIPFHASIMYPPIALELPAQHMHHSDQQKGLGFCTFDGLGSSFVHHDQVAEVN